jgi:urea carboxylase
MTQQAQARYTWGGDEFLLIEIGEEMSLEANFIGNAICAALVEKNLDGLIDIAPSNASLLIRFNPDVIAPADLETAVRKLEQDVRNATTHTLKTRIIEVPVWYDDPITAEAGKRFREGFHQRPEGNDLDYAAEVNGLADAAEFIKRHHESPWFVSMIGFVAGVPFLYQLVDREHQLEVPKYKSPRTDTPERTLGHGGCFGAIYAVRGAGGYQMFGILAGPIYEPEQTLADFKEFSVLFTPGDIVKFKPIDETEYNRVRAEVEAGTFTYRQTPFTFDMGAAITDPEGYNSTILGALNGI